MVTEWGRGAFSRLPVPLRLLCVNATLAVATLATSVMLARALDPEGRGVLAAFTIWPLTLSHLALAGVHLHLGRLVGRCRERARAYYRHGYVAIAATTSIAGLLWISIDVLTPVWPAAATRDLELMFLLLSTAIIPFSSWNALQVQLELGRGAFATYNLARASFALLHLVFVSACVLLVQTGVVTYLGCFVAAAAASSALAGLAIASSLRRNGDVGTSDAPEPGYAATFRQSWPFAISTATVALMTMADRILISVFFDARTLGLYVVAIAMTQLQSVINEATAPLYFSRLARHASLATVDVGWLAQRLRQSMIVNIVVAIGLLTIAPILLPLVFGAAYADALTFVGILVPAVALRAAIRPFEEVLKAINKPMMQASVISSMSATFAILGAGAAYLGSPVGVAFALLAANAIGLALVLLRLRHVSGLTVAEMLLPGWSDLADLVRALRRASGKE